MPTAIHLRHLRKGLLAALCVAIAVLGAVSSGGFGTGGGDEEGGSGFGGTGRTPTGGSGLGGTGMRPFLGATGEVRIRFEPQAVPIADQVSENDIQRLPKAVAAPPPTVVSALEFAAEHPAEIAITDSIQLQLRRDALIHQRISEDLEGYHLPAEKYIAPAAVDIAAPETSTVPVVIAAAQNAPAAPPPAVKPDFAPAGGSTEGRTEPSGSHPESPAAAADEGPSWADLVQYFAEKGSEPNSEPTPLTSSPEAAESSPEFRSESNLEAAAVRRPQRIQRPELPPVQRGRIIRRPAILPPRIQPMR